MHATTIAVQLVSFLNLFWVTCLLSWVCFPVSVCAFFVYVSNLSNVLFATHRKLKTNEKKKKNVNATVATTNDKGNHQLLYINICLHVKWCHHCCHHFLWLFPFLSLFFVLFSISIVYVVNSCLILICCSLSLLLVFNFGFATLGGIIRLFSTLLFLLFTI